MVEPGSVRVIVRYRGMLMPVRMGLADLAVLCMLMVLVVEVQMLMHDRLVSANEHAFRGAKEQPYRRWFVIFSWAWSTYKVECILKIKN